MSDTDPQGIPADDIDVDHPSQAEGADPDRTDDEVVVLEAVGQPSQAEGDDSDHDDPHEVLAP